jgi:hypothetical protein
MKWKFLIYVDDTGLDYLPKELVPTDAQVFGFVGTNDSGLALLLANQQAYRVVDVAAGAELSSKDNAEGSRVQWAVNEIEFKS